MKFFVFLSAVIATALAIALPAQARGGPRAMIAYGEIRFPAWPGWCLTAPRNIETGAVVTITGCEKTNIHQLWLISVAESITTIAPARALFSDGPPLDVSVGPNDNAVLSNANLDDTVITRIDLGDSYFAFESPGGNRLATPLKQPGRSESYVAKWLPGSVGNTKKWRIGPIDFYAGPIAFAPKESVL